MENNRYSPQYPLTFQVIELTKYDKILRVIMFIAFFAYIFSIGIKHYGYLQIICIATLILTYITSAIIRGKKKHYSEKGKMVLYDNRVELKQDTGIETLLLNENQLKANLREYTTEAAPMGTLSWLKGEVGNSITFSRGDKQIRYHFFLDNPSHAKMLVRRLEEWKAKGVSCTYKTSSAVYD